MSQFFELHGKSIGVSALVSVFPMSIQDWFHLEFIGLITLQSKGPQSPAEPVLKASILQ